MAILSIGSDAKTVKGEARGFRTAICYMAPHTIAVKRSVCPYSTAECRAACLYSAGKGVFENVQAARIARTRLFDSNPEAFLQRTHSELDDFVARTLAKGMVPTARLNGTSDIRFESMPYTYGGVQYASIMHAFPIVQFYDYTKFPMRYRQRMANYHLTFSYTGHNGREALEWLDEGVNVAVVFEKALPDSFTLAGRSVPVLNGDEHDLRFLDPRGYVVGLKAKGKARKSNTAFVNA